MDTQNVWQCIYHLPRNILWECCNARYYANNIGTTDDY